MEQIVPRSIAELAERQRQADLVELNAKQLDIIALLERDLTISRNIEASLRRELAEERETNARSTQRVKALEARLAHIENIAGGHAIVDEGSAEE